MREEEVNCCMEWWRRCEDPIFLKQIDNQWSLFRSIPNSGPCVSWSSHWMRAIPSGGPLVRWPLLCVCVCVCVCLHAHSVASNSLRRSHGLKPARLLYPWNFPGKNTGVGYSFLLQGIFPTQASDSCLLCLMHWQADSLPLPSHSPWPKALLSWGLSWYL